MVLKVKWHYTTSLLVLKYLHYWLASVKGYHFLTITTDRLKVFINCKLGVITNWSGFKAFTLSLAILQRFCVFFHLYVNKLLRILEDYNLVLEINFGDHRFDVCILLDVLFFHWWVCCLLHITFMVFNHGWDELWHLG